MNRWFCFFSIVAFITAVIKIVFHLDFWVIPVVFFVIGLVSALLNQQFSLFLFVFLFPFINSSPALFNTEYPFNYLAPALFLLSGMVFATLVNHIKNKKAGDTEPAFVLDKGFYPYYLFLVLLFISAIFVFLRWSNITLSSTAAVGADIPVAPDHPLSPDIQRLSFGSVFPVVSLFIYFISPYIFFYVKKIKPPGKMVFKWMSYGFYVSIAFAIFQKISGRSLISDRLGKELKQFYGGFSDFNAFGFFSGVMFLWSTYEIKNKNPLGFVTFVISLVGTMLSGSRTAFLFILAGIGNLIFSALKDRERQRKIVVVILIVGVLAAVIFAGGTLKKRLSEGFSGNQSLFEKLDAITNGRLWMTLFSLETLRDNFVEGVGTGNFTFYLAYKNYLPYKQQGEKYTYDLTLNHYLLVFTENGVLGFLAFTFFMILLYRRSNKKLLIGTILAALLLNNFFWFPEAFLLFWILAALTDSGKEDVLEKSFLSRINKRAAVIASVFLIILANIVSFHSLHPGTWAQKAGYRYDYGFWYPEKDEEGNEFRWTTGCAGIYLTLDKTGESPGIKLYCGAPLNHLNEKQQKVEIYWQGKLYREYTFMENKGFSFKIKSRPLEEGFLEVKVIPVFNLEKLGLSPETRDLGVRFFLH
ncbi:MAG: O-antigen ligase family protein [Candidatus Aminicenantes bacterium]|nr:MAG: O-antigen ligase family protein [Candidatus Aminicenantes bacterium]